MTRYHTYLLHRSIFFQQIKNQRKKTIRFVPKPITILLHKFVLQNMSGVCFSIKLPKILFRVLFRIEDESIVVRIETYKLKTPRSSENRVDLQALEIHFIFQR